MPSDYRVAVGWRNHPKRLKLHRRLGTEAVVAVFDLWEFCASCKTDGDLSGMSDEDIAVASGYGGSPEKFVAALVDVGLLDGSRDALFVHDWKTHNPWVFSAAERSIRSKMNVHERWAKGGQAHRKTEWCTKECRNLPEDLRKKPNTSAITGAKDPYYQTLLPVIAPDTNRNTPTPVPHEYCSSASRTPPCVSSSDAELSPPLAALGRDVIVPTGSISDLKPTTELLRADPTKAFLDQGQEKTRPSHGAMGSSTADEEVAYADEPDGRDKDEEDAGEDLAIVAGSGVVSRKASSVGLVWNHWLTHKPNTRRKILDSKCPEYKLITKALGSYSVDDLRLAIDGLFLEPWSAEKMPELSWALRRDTKHNNIERFIALATEASSKPPEEDPFVKFGLPPRSDPRYDKAITMRWQEIRIGAYGMAGVFVLDNIASWLHPETLERIGNRLEEANEIYTEWRKRKQETQEAENAQRCCA